MLQKEFTINHSLDDIRNAVTLIATKHSNKYKNLKFDDSFSLIKLWGDVNLGVGVSIDMYYDVIDKDKTKLRIEYVGSKAKQSINEANEASFEREFSDLFSKYLKGDVDEQGTATGSGAGCMLSTLIIIAATAAIALGIYGLCL